MSPSSVSARVAQTVLGMFVVLGVLVPGAWAQANVQGQWSAVTNWPILPIHVTLMPTGKVLAWGHDATNNTTLGTIWDPSTNSFQTTSFSNADLFCSGHGLLADGRVFVAGGHNMADYMASPRRLYLIRQPQSGHLRPRCPSHAGIRPSPRCRMAGHWSVQERSTVTGAMPLSPRSTTPRRIAGLS